MADAPTAEVASVAESGSEISNLSSQIPSTPPLARVYSPAPVLRFVTWNQITVDGKLAGPAADLMAKRPELIPAMVALFRAREAKQEKRHTALLAAAKSDLPQGKSP